MYEKSSGLALLTAVGTALMVAACSSASSASATGAGNTSASSATSTASSAASTAAGASTPASPAASSAGAVPAGYQRVGGSAQGISLATPKTWVSIDLAKESIDAAAKKLAVPGLSASAAEQDMSALQKDHAIFAYDIASVTSDPNHFARNINAYCLPSGVTDTGSAGIPLLQQSAKTELATIGTDITQKDITIGGVPGIETSYKLNNASGGEILESQLEVLPKSDVGCFVTLSYSGSEGAGNYLAVAAATAQFP